MPHDRFDSTKQIGPQRFIHKAPRADRIIPFARDPDNPLALFFDHTAQPCHQLAVFSDCGVPIEDDIIQIRQTLNEASEKIAGEIGEEVLADSKTFEYLVRRITFHKDD